MGEASGPGKEALASSALKHPMGPEPIVPVGCTEYGVYASVDAYMHFSGYR
jgi:hypothetical protein